MYEPLQHADVFVLRLVGDLVGRVPQLGGLLGAVLNADLVKTAIPLAALWLLWLSPSGRIEARLPTVLCSLVGLVAAIGAGRACQILLPFRPRPLFDPAMAEELPHPELAAQFDGWSAFPSDHGALAGALIAAAFALSRRAGFAMSAWLLLVVCLPRLYFGLHWPSDMVAGLGLGIGVSALVLQLGMPRRVIDLGRAVAARRPAATLAVLFLVSFEIASLFDSTRLLGRSLARLVTSTG